MLPDRAVRRVSALKLEGRLLGALLECLVNLGFSAGCRVDLLKLRDRKRRFLPPGGALVFPGTRKRI